MSSPAAGIRLFAMDVDGTLTDGAIIYLADGEELKSFSARDGAAIKLLTSAGIQPALVSGRDSEVVRRRAAELGIAEVHLGVLDKASQLLEMAARLGLDAASAAFMGDDLSDIPAMALAGFSACPSDAAPEVIAIADFVSQQPGGRGAVREAIEALLKAAGHWDALIASLLRRPQGQRA